jgi:hypothetical protein
LAHSTRPPGLKGALREWARPLDAPISKFVGRVDSSSFKLRRNIRYRNSFLPVIRGYVMPTATGTDVQVRIVAPALVVGILPGCAYALAQLVLERTAAHGTDLLIAGSLSLVVIAAVMGDQASEVRKARRLLQQVLDGTRR